MNVSARVKNGLFVWPNVKEHLEVGEISQTWRGISRAGQLASLTITRFLHLSGHVIFGLEYGLAGI
jgi:uncharacterized protein with NRDE domain